MAQIKIFGLKESLDPARQTLSDTIHSCVMEALDYPADKRFHRFIGLEREDFIYPPSRSERYTIIEINMFEGRSAPAKKKLIRLLCQKLEETCGIGKNDLEITIFESPRANWGIRGLPGDELELNYKVEV